MASRDLSRLERRGIALCSVIRRERGGRDEGGWRGVSASNELPADTCESERMRLESSRSNSPWSSVANNYRSRRQRDDDDDAINEIRRRVVRCASHRRHQDDQPTGRPSSNLWTDGRPADRPDRTQSARPRSPISYTPVALRLHGDSPNYVQPRVSRRARVASPWQVVVSFDFPQSTVHTMHSVWQYVSVANGRLAVADTCVM